MSRTQLIDIPRLVEELFPDDVLPFPVETIADKLPTTLLRPTTEDTQSDRWALNTDFFAPGISDASAECSLVTFLNTICTALRAACAGSEREIPSEMKWTRQGSDSEETDEEEPPATTQKLGVILGEDRELHTWNTVTASVQLKPNANDHVKAQRQLLDAASLVLASQDERRFFIGATVAAHDVRVYVFDRAGLLGSESFDVRCAPLLLIRLLAGLTLTKRHVIGFDPTILHEGEKRYVSVCGKRYEIMELLFLSDSVHGRGTVCWHARRGGIDYVIKNTWVDITRSHNEVALLGKVSGIDGLSTLVDWEFVKNDVDDRHSTSAIRKFIMPQTTYKWIKRLLKLEVREHIRVVSTPCAVGLSHFSTKRELLSVIIDAIQAHQRLLEKDILHRDISLGNIMIYQPIAEPADIPHIVSPELNTSPTLSITNNLSRKGLLIDLDYAILMKDGDKDVNTGHQTGTLPFMAIGLLQGDRHTPRHDLESFLYVLIWVAVHHAGPNNAKRKNFDVEETIIETWTNAKHSITNIALSKPCSFGDDVSFERNVLHYVAPYFEDLKPCLRELRAVVFGDDLKHDDVVDVLRRAMEALPARETWSAKDDPKGYGLQRKYRTWGGTVRMTSKWTTLESEDDRYNEDGSDKYEDARES